MTTTPTPAEATGVFPWEVFLIYLFVILDRVTPPLLGISTGKVKREAQLLLCG